MSMIIAEAIKQIKNYYRGLENGLPIDPEKTRDQILYGDAQQALTGIVTTCYVTPQVIDRAVSLGANLIICHEGMFWNHGNHTDWLKDDPIYQEKVRKLEAGRITVWRNHDYIHSGLPLGDGRYTDGIFYGLAKELGWEKYLSFGPEQPTRFSLPRTTVRELGEFLKTRFHLNGMKVIGALDSPVERVWIPGHIFGGNDNRVIQALETENIDTILAMECVDFTAAGYVRDAAMMGHPKTILFVGHFNLEEPGMAYMVQYLPSILGASVPCAFVPSSDMYCYL